MTLEEFKKEVDRNIKNLFNKANNEEKELLNSMINTINNLSKREQELIDYLKEKIKKTKESWGNSIYYNNEKGMFEVQIEIRLLEEILSKIEKE